MVSPSSDGKTIYGVYDDGDYRARVNYCAYCAGLLYREFTPISSTALDFRGLVIQALPLPGETMTVEAYVRIVDDLLLRPRGDA